MGNGKYSYNPRRQARREANREYVTKAKDVPCADCDRTYPPFVMDFDHVRGKKEFTLARAASSTLSLERIKKEIEKCEVVCANCHRLRTFA